MKIKFILKLGAGLTALSMVLVGCSGSSSSVTDASAAADGTVTGIATPSKVSIVNTN